MNSVRIRLGTAAVAALGAGLWFHQGADAGETPAYRFATVELADLQSTGSAAAP